MNRQQRRAAGKQATSTSKAVTHVDAALPFNEGLAHHQAGRLVEAEKAYRRVLAAQPDHADALHLLGVLAIQSGRPDIAVELIGQALRQAGANVGYLSNLALAKRQVGRFSEALEHLDRALILAPGHFEAVANRGEVLFKLGRFAEALATFDQLIKLKPDLPEAFNGHGAVLKELGRFGEALQSYDHAITLRPDFADALLNRGNVLRELGREEEAIASFERTLAANADFADAWHNRGCALQAQSRDSEALASFQRAVEINPRLFDAHNYSGIILFGAQRFADALAVFERAAALRPDLASAWLACANVLCRLGRYEDALQHYEHALQLDVTLAPVWHGRGNALSDLKRYEDALEAYDRALSLDRTSTGAWLGRGNVCRELKRTAEAIAAYDASLALDPRLAEAHLGRGNLFSELGSHDNALAAYDQALSLRDDMAEAWLGRGNVLLAKKQISGALSDYDRALQLKPDLPGVEGTRLKVKMQVCDWSDFETERTKLLTSLEQGRIILPFDILSIVDSARVQSACSRSFGNKAIPAATKPNAADRRSHGRIRIAYMSADFRQHPMSSLMAEIFERHDRNRFELTAISIGQDDASPMRKRLEAAFDHFVEAGALSDDDIVRLIMDAEIDILIDLMGYTKGNRMGVVTRRPAPVQVNYLGFAGTMGTPLIDYIIADRIVIPDAHRAFYAEKIAYLPHTYYPNGREPRSSNVAARIDNGLPDQAFVFCCFNNSFKILPDVFAAWMRILDRVNGSVLWLLADNDAAAMNLREAAAVQNIDPARLVFAGRVPPSEHMARHACADLILDTLPYNAHTTALDALWEGVPVLTRPGEAFASRVAASLLRALGMPELIAATMEEYEASAVMLASDPDRFASIKQKLAANRTTAPLFDSARFTRELENAYDAMHARAQACLAPEDFVVPSH
jgi:protein O-GlcNAc transferase